MLELTILTISQNKLTHFPMSLCKLTINYFMFTTTWDSTKHQLYYTFAFPLFRISVKQMYGIIFLPTLLLLATVKHSLNVCLDKLYIWFNTLYELKILATMKLAFSDSQDVKNYFVSLRRCPRSFITLTGAIIHFYNNLSFAKTNFREDNESG